jgi:DnaJ-class molecular chaperone
MIINMETESKGYACPACGGPGKFITSTITTVKGRIVADERDCTMCNGTGIIQGFYIVENTGILIN